jgi:hypothetical protein
MKIHNKDYTVQFDPSSGDLAITGTLRLMNKDYAEIRELLEQVLRLGPPRLEFDVQALKMVNSSGLNTLSRFVLSLRGKPEVRVTFHGSKEVVWQARVLANMQHFLPSAQVVLH